MGKKGRVDFMYRPQFPYWLTPPAYEDHEFDHYFDSTNTPLLNNTSLAAAGIIQNIPLTLVSDFPFYARAIAVRGLNGVDPVVAVQFKDPFENYLSDDYVPLDLYISPNATATQGGWLSVVIEPEIRCPRGGCFWLSVKNQTSGSADITKVRVTISGVKRRLAKAVNCAA
jgi:hypothetical protein